MTITFQQKLKAIFRRSRYRRPFVTFIGVAVFCIVVVPVLITYVKEGDKGGAFTEYTSDKSAVDKVDISVDLLSMDPVARTANFFVQLDPVGNLLDEEGLLATNLTINFRFKKVKYQIGTSVEPFTMSVPFIDGSLRDYPMDQYQTAFPLVLKGSKDGTKIKINYHIRLDGVSQLFKIRYKVVSSQKLPGLVEEYYLTDNPSELVLVSLTRPPTTRMICAFMAILMWILSIALANVAWDVVIYRRDIPPPILSLGVSMLFALPALRNSQPGVPAMGCFADMAGFFWSIVLIAISASLLIFTFVLAWKPDFMRRPVLQQPRRL